MPAGGKAAAKVTEKEQQCGIVLSLMQDYVHATVGRRTLTPIGIALFKVDDHVIIILIFFFF